MNATRVDYLNIGLILLSAILAFQFPLELFVVAFIFIGPLHYFTEINWLDKKNYFIESKKRLWLWIGLGASFLLMLPKLFFLLTEQHSGALYNAMVNVNHWTNACYFLTFVAAIGFVVIRKRIYWLILLLPAVAIAVVFNANYTYTSLIGLFLPTIIHVYVFTLVFMAYGAKKSKSRQGMFAVLLAMLIPLMIFGIEIPGNAFQFSEWMMTTYVDSNFYSIPNGTAKFFGWSDGTNFNFNGTLELKLMTFLSFIYMYHYLNWFSKTSLIQWHKSLTWTRSIIIATTWAILLIVLYFNFALGLWVAILFSAVHVILEFPLNILSIRGLFLKD